MASTARSRALMLLVLLAAGLSACGGDEGPPQPTGLVVVSGNAQSAAVAAQLAAPLVVRVTGKGGRGLEGITVTWSVAEGGGSLVQAQPRTGANGLAQAGWIMGTVAGPARVVVSAAGLAGVTLELTATVLPGPPASIVPVSGSGQSAEAGAALPAPLVVRVADLYDNGVPNVAVTFSAGSGGTLSPASATTGEDGRAQSAWTLGTTMGLHSASASVSTLPGSVAAFTATATAAALTEVQVVPDTLRLRTLADSVQLAARGLDRHGNSLPGLAWTWQSATPAVATVNAAGWVRAVSSGTAVISATAQDGSGKRGQATITVDLPPRLTNDVPLTQLAGELNSMRYYTFIVPDGSPRLTVTTTGGAPGNDVDLFIRHGEPPTVELATCTSAGPTAAELCIVNKPEPGEWHILLHGFTAYTGVTLRATYQEPPVPGSLTVNVSGLPAGVPGAVTLSGPDGYRSTLTGTQTLTGLLPGSYTVEAEAVLSGASYYDPAPLQQSVSVSSSTTATANVVYGPSAGLNLRIDGLHLTQSTQTYGGAVPLVANRPGLLRVFGRANHPNTAAATVRVRFYDGTGALLDTRTVSAASAAVPTSITEGALDRSWNVQVPATLMLPGLRVLADIDPGNAVAEVDEQDNVFPAGGTPRTLDVRTPTPFAVTLVPVLQSGNSLQGDVTAANAESYTVDAYRMYPVPSVDAVVRTPYTFSGTISSGYDSTWSRLLNEIRMLQAAEGTTRYYYGVLKPSYTYGGTGLGYVGLPAAIGVDWASRRAGTAAHEWGHNFGRLHVDCGGASNPDLAYPHEGGFIGTWGYDMASGQLRSPAAYFDLMSYCAPEWISDYTYNAVLSWRAGHANGPVSAAPRQGLLVSGRIARGQVVLEPAFEIEAPPLLPVRGGSYTLEATDGAGRRLFGFSFEAQRMDHLDEEHFTFVIPLEAGEHAAALRVLRQGSVAAELRSPDLPAAMAAGAASVAASARAAGRVRVTWDAASHPAALIRDARSGEILSFARGGVVDVATAAEELDVTLSRGASSERRRLRVVR